MNGQLELIEAESGPDPRTALLILHGLGADGNDFVPVAQEFDLEALGPVRFVLPHAPVRPVTINGGMPMRAWYDILGTEAQGGQDEAGLRQSMDIVEHLIARERERGVPAERIVLMGFSQGCAMALLTGLRHPERLGAIVGLSGYLPLADRTEAERSPANLGTPIFLAHGMADEVVAFERAEATRDQLRALGHPVHWREYPMGHGVCMEEVQELNAWLLEVLAPAG